jgi:hypothetical protein
MCYGAEHRLINASAHDVFQYCSLKAEFYGFHQNAGSISDGDTDVLPKGFT